MDDNKNQADTNATEATDVTNVTEASAEKTETQPSDNPFAALKATTGQESKESEAAADAEEEEIEEPEVEVTKEAEVTEETKASEGLEAAETEEQTTEEPEAKEEPSSSAQATADKEEEKPAVPANPNAKWYVVHTFAGHENKVAAALKQRIEAEHLENLIFDILVPTQDKIEIRGGKKETVKEKIFPGYILIKMELSDLSWLAVRTTQGVTSFIGAGNKPTPISEAEVATIVKFTTQGASPTFKDVFMVDDTVKIIDGPFAEFIGKVDSVDKEKGRVRVLVSIFGRETPVELDFLQVQKL